MSFRKIEKKIMADGWVLVRVCGSHYQYSKAGCAESVVIPYHGGRDISIGVVLSIECATGLPLRRWPCGIFISAFYG